jgi:hypothetical protein
MTMELAGSCHCGALSLRLETAKPIGELPVRICSCSFCLKHRPRYTSDPAGRATIRMTEAAASRYRFGLRLADFIVCRQCGVFVAAFADGRAVINIEVLDRAHDFTSIPTRFTADVYDAEDVLTRTARRARNWMPATIELD